MQGLQEGSDARSVRDGGHRGVMREGYEHTWEDVTADTRSGLRRVRGEIIIVYHQG
jgi:hypothetical protein